MDNNIIVTESYSDLRAMSRKVIKDKWGQLAMVMFIFSLLYKFLPSFLGNVFPVFNRTIYLGITDSYYKYSTFPVFYALIIEGAFLLGMSMFVLNFIRVGRVSYELLFSGFERFIKVFILNLLISVVVALWTLLFIIPGFVAILRYSQAFFIMADNPELSALECMRRSKQMMRGNKAYLLGLRLSFLGWGMLAGGFIFFCLHLAYTYKIMNINIIAQELIMIFAYIPMYYVMAYMQITSGIFYELATGHIRPVVTPTYANTYGSLNQNSEIKDAEGIKVNTVIENNRPENANTDERNPDYDKNIDEER